MTRKFKYTADGVKGKRFVPNYTLKEQENGNKEEDDKEQSETKDNKSGGRDSKQS